jgi:hypothetical protein
MKLDPGMHIGMHLVSFGKSGVTEVVKENPRERFNHGPVPKNALFSITKIMNSTHISRSVKHM